MATQMESRILDSEYIVDPANARFVYMKKLTWRTPEGKPSFYEVAERKAHGKSEADAVSVMPIIRSATNKFKPSTVIVKQYRPPMDAMVLEFPAGLVDPGESALQAAIRELYEETGYYVRKGEVSELVLENKKDFPMPSAEELANDSTLEITSLQGADPGMTTANLKLVTAYITLPGELAEYPTNLDAGEFLTREVVAIEDLPEIVRKSAANGFIIDAKLAFWVHGYEMAKKLQATL